MTTRTLRRHVETLLTWINTDKALIKYLFILSRRYEHITLGLAELLYMTNRTLFSKQHQESKDAFVELRRQTETLPFGQIFHDAIELRRALTETEQAFAGHEATLFVQMGEAVDRFYEAFEQYTRASDDESFAKVLIEATHLYPMLSSIRRTLLAVEASLVPTTEGRRGQRRIELYYEATTTLEGIGRKLKALERAYAELADLLGGPVTPLEATRVETGDPTTPGLWVVVQGDATAAAILASLLGHYAQFLYRRFESGERLSEASERVLSTQSLVNLADELDRAAIDGISEDRLREGAMVLRRELTDLLVGEPVLELDGHRFEVPPGAHERYLRESSQFVGEGKNLVHLSRQAS